MSVRTRSKLTFRHMRVKYQKNARSLTIHVYVNGAEGFASSEAVQAQQRDGFGGRPGSERSERASRARPARSRYRGGHRRRRSGTPGAPLPHPVRGGQPQPASPSVELPWSAVTASIFDPPEAASVLEQPRGASPGCIGTPSSRTPAHALPSDWAGRPRLGAGPAARRRPASSKHVAAAGRFASLSGSPDTRESQQLERRRSRRSSRGA